MEQMPILSRATKSPAKARKVTHLLLIRHGQTEANRLHINQGTSQTSLNDLGRRQAQHLAKHLVDFKPPVEILLCSDLDRAISTAAPISQALQLPINIDARWRERCYGAFQGLTKEQREAYKKQHKMSEDDIPPGAQTLDEYQHQILAAFTDLTKKIPDAHCIAVVTHGGACRAILNLLANGTLPGRANHPTIPVDYTPNCSITHVTMHEIEGDVRYDLVCCQDVGHLTRLEVTKTDEG